MDSFVIVDYLSITRKVENHWFPVDVRQRARISEYIHWHHLNTRLSSAMLFQNLVCGAM